MIAPAPHYSKVYSDVPATRSPILTVFLAILILAVLHLAPGYRALVQTTIGSVSA